MKNKSIYNLTLSGLFIAIGLILPYLFHSIPQSGAIFLPMHIPVLLCGLICGWKFGLPVGIITPILSFLLTGKPSIFPIGLSMMFELGAYGLVSGLLSKKVNPILALISAMFVGRIVMGIANVVILGYAGEAYAFSGFISGAFITALPGIIIQLILIPAIIFALKKNNLFKNEV